VNSHPGFVRDPWSSVHPASCFGDCFQQCLDDGGMSKSGCRTICAQDCGGVPRDPGSVTPPSAPAAGGLPIYGNYCGPGFGDVTGVTPPVDAVDAACRTHDLCYGARGYFNCGCDRALIAAMPAAIAATGSGAGRAAGSAVLAYFTHAPCSCTTTVCPPFLPCVPVSFPGGVGGIGVC
jgi:hypothetical protein